MDSLECMESSGQQEECKDLDLRVKHGLVKRLTIAEVQQKVEVLHVDITKHGEFASLPAIIPKGPIAIFGLGGGTTAHLMLTSWPSLQLEGWEIDGILIEKARDFLGLSGLEKHSGDGGILSIHISDALDPSVRISGGYAGIVVDLFSVGKILPQLQEAGMWFDLKDRLMVGGRLMINCGGNEAANVTDNVICNEVSSTECLWPHNSVIEALSKAFPEQLCWKKLPKGKGDNYLALTRPFPELHSWSVVVPKPLRASVKEWRPYERFSWSTDCSLI